MEENQVTIEGKTRTLAARFAHLLEAQGQIVGEYDANGDGSVDVFDLAVLANNYALPGNKDWTVADYNLDGAVDVFDLAILANNYGYDGTGGVVNVVRPPLPSAPAGESVIHGDVGVAWHGNNDQLQGSVAVEGGYGGFGWRLGVVGRDTGDIDTPDGELANTDYEQTNFDAAVGLSGTWGSAQVRWNHWNNDVGFYFPPGNPSSGFRLDLEDDFLAADAHKWMLGPEGVGLMATSPELRRRLRPAVTGWRTPSGRLRSRNGTSGYFSPMRPPGKLQTFARVLAPGRG